MVRRGGLALLVCALGCRDVSLPPPKPSPGPGTVYGTVEIAVAGGGYAPAAGAQVGLLGSSLSTTAGTQGDFLLDGLSVARGKLLFRYGDGAEAKQKLIRLEDVHAGPGRDIGLGEVVLSENASIHGRVVLGDRAGSNTGHGGTRVFVPGSPYQGITADDGSFLIQGLPEGPTDVSAFHAGYVAAGVAAIELRAAESFEVSELTLPVDPGAQPGAVEGRVTLHPAGSAMVAVQAIDSGGQARGANATMGAYGVEGLPPDVYSIRASAPGYAPAVVPNVLVPAGKTVDVPEIVLGQGAQIDAGFVEVDAGCTFCGSSCTTTLDCPATQWCDAHLCRPLCGSAADCGGGRACDATTHTCVTPCSNGCPAGSGCDLNRNACEAECDLSTPCPAGLHCGSSGVCVPDCVAASDCTGAHQTCAGGFCRPDGTCASDPDCLPAEYCSTGGNCLPRDAGQVLVDGGLVFLCGQPCDCKLGEICSSGSCVADVLPTAFVRVGGLGDGGEPQQAAGDLQAMLSGAATLALLGSDVWVSDAGFSTDAGVSLLGGFVACNPRRWVRDPAAKTALVGQGAVAFGAGAVRSLRSISFSALGPACNSQPMVHLVQSDGVVLTDLELRADSANCGSVHDLLLCDGCQGYASANVLLSGSYVQTSGTVRGLHFVGGHGSIGPLSTAALADQADFAAVRVDSLEGPVSIWLPDYRGPYTAGSQTVVDVEQCNGETAEIADSGIHWSAHGQYSVFKAIKVGSCHRVSIHDDTLAGVAVPGYTPSPTGIELSGAAGVVQRVEVAPPDNGGVGGFTGIVTTQSAGDLELGENVIDAGTFGSSIGIKCDGAPMGTVLVHDNDVRLVGSDSTGLYLNNIAGIIVRDNTVYADSQYNPYVYAVGLTANANVAGVVERNRLTAVKAGSAIGLFVQGGVKQLELYDNYLHAGASVGSPGSVGLFTQGSQGQLWAAGNTIEGEGDPFSANSAGIDCSDAISGVFTSNLIGGGVAPNHPMLLASGACLGGSSFGDNYFWYAASGGESGTDQVHSVARADGGVADSSGNIIGGPAGCQLPHPTTTPWRIDAGTPCVGRGAAPSRQDLSAVTLDVEGQPRTTNGKVDIGCYQVQ